jgi:hypothetical protein
MVNEKQISFNPAVELSHLLLEHQELLYSVIQQKEITPSLSTVELNNVLALYPGVLIKQVTLKQGLILSLQHVKIKVLFV